jgi:hypothetical protein
MNATKPPIDLTIIDPFYTAASKHFNNLFERYGTPILILNLIKSREPQPRESKLLRSYGECVQYLNQFLPEGKKMLYRAWDMSRAYKKKQDVIGYLEDLAEEWIHTTGFFHSGPEPYSHLAKHQDGSHQYRSTISLQNGIARVNCVDCLDRTNAAQFVFGKRALGHQLYALGVVDNPVLEFDSDAVNMLTQMWHDHGDTIALQYTGSHLVNRVETYRRMPHWSSHSRDMIENIRRFYANSMLDGDKQFAMNVFLGVNDPPATMIRLPPRRPYRQWYDPVHLEQIFVLDKCQASLREFANEKANFWTEYYRPQSFTSLGKHFAFQMNSSLKLPGKTPKEMHISPFTARTSSSQPRLMDGVRRWMGSYPPSVADTVSDEAEHNQVLEPRPELKLPDPNTIEGLVWRLLSPSVSEEEEDEYEEYVEQYQTLLTSSGETAERKDLDLYLISSRIPLGELPDSLELDLVPPVYQNYVEAYQSEPPAPLPRMDANGYPTGAPPFSYEKWVGSTVPQRKASLL